MTTESTRTPRATPSECQKLLSDPLDSNDLRAWRTLAMRLEGRLRDADYMAAVIDEMIYAGHLDARSQLSDARLDYGNPFTDEPQRKALLKPSEKTEMIECESCIGSGKIREEGETPEQDRWRRCMDCTGTGQVPAPKGRQSAAASASPITRQEAVTLFCEIANRRLHEAECFNLTENMRATIAEFANACMQRSATASLTTEQIFEWSQRHDIHASATDLKAMIDDARSL